MSIYRKDNPYMDTLNNLSVNETYLLLVEELYESYVKNIMEKENVDRELAEIMLALDERSISSRAANARREIEGSK